MANIPQQSLAFTVTSNQRMPKEGPKVVPVAVPFTGPNTDFDLDLTVVEQLTKISMVQGIFIDNSANGSQIAVTAVDSQQTVKLPANSQGFLVLFVPTPSKIHFNSAGAVTLVCCLYNFPVSPFVWKTA